jgi:hypothetical protein
MMSSPENRTACVEEEKRLGSVVAVHGRCGGDQVAVAELVVTIRELTLHTAPKSRGTSNCLRTSAASMKALAPDAAIELGQDDRPTDLIRGSRPGRTAPSPHRRPGLGLLSTAPRPARSDGCRARPHAV